MTTQMTGSELRAEGMARAVNAAGDTWAKQAYETLTTYLKKFNTPFLVEDVRAFAVNSGLPIPPSNRAWGSIISRAKRDGIVKQVGYTQVKNPKAHMTNVAVWVGA